MNKKDKKVGDIVFTVDIVAKSKGFENAHEVAKETKMTYSVILNLWKNKSKRVDCETLASLCALFKCQPDELMKFVPNQPT